MREKVYQQIKQTSLSITQNEIQAVRRKNISKTGCRVISNGTIGIAGGMGQVDEEQLFARAQAALKYDIEYQVEPTKNFSSETKFERMTLTDMELCSKVDKILKTCKQKHPDFAMSNKVNMSKIAFGIENEIGLSVSYHDAYVSLSFLLKSNESTGIMDTFFGLVEREIDTDKVINSIDEVICAYKTQLPMPDKPLPVIIDQGALTRVFQRDLNGKLLGNKASLFQAQIGAKTFSDQFSARIANDPEETFGPAFDMEGTVIDSELSWLIKNGTIIRPYTDKKTAAKYGFENTGCAGGSYDGVPSLGGCNMEIEHSGKTLKELLNGEKGILITIASGGDFTPDGIFASPVQLAHLTDGEKLLGRLPEFSIKGSVYDFFGKDFIGVSSDRLFSCGNERMAVVRLAINQL